MTDYKVGWDQLANDDLNDIYRHIATESYAPKAAQKLVYTIREAGNDLWFSPYWPLVDDEELAKLGLRKKVEGNYIIFYIIHKDENVISIERIIHGRRNWVKILRTMYGIETSP